MTTKYRSSSTAAFWESHRSHYGNGVASLFSVAIQVPVQLLLLILHDFLVNHRSRVLLCRNHHYSAYSINLLGCDGNVQAC